MNIFYSWQSDLSSKDNRNFIESCIKQAIKEFNQENKFTVNFKLDKDTSGEPGNPEILNSILKKIDASRVFVCDLSIINPSFEGRKTPNPNVVFELGYAIKSLGWEKIICIANEEYGGMDVLPFDMKHRRMLTYNLLSKERLKEKKRIVDAIKSNINILNERGLLHDELEDYFKRDIDTEFLTIANHLRKIVFTDCSQNLLLDTVRLLNLSKEELRKKLFDRTILGFHLFKSFDLNASSLKKQIDNIISVADYKKEKIVALIKFLNWLERYNSFTSERSFPNLFTLEAKVSGYKLIGSNDKKLPNRFILGKLKKDKTIIVHDFGDIKLKPKVNKALHNHKINDEHFDNYVDLIFAFIEATCEWLDKTGGQFIIDTLNQFEMK